MKNKNIIVMSGNNCELPHARLFRIQGRIIEEFPFNTELGIKLEISYKMEIQKLQSSKIKLVMILSVIHFSVCRPWCIRMTILSPSKITVGFSKIFHPLRIPVFWTSAYSNCDWTQLLLWQSLEIALQKLFWIKSNEKYLFPKQVLQTEQVLTFSYRSIFL